MSGRVASKCEKSKTMVVVQCVRERVLLKYDIDMQWFETTYHSAVWLLKLPEALVVDTK